MSEWNQVVQMMIDWVEERIPEGPSLLEMSKRLGYSPYYCSTQFHAVVGMTLRSYIASRRLARATLEIRDTRARILDIAIKYGYSSQEALTRAFVTAYGCTPAAYRRNPSPLPLPIRQMVLYPQDQKGELMVNLRDARVHMEYIPAHKYIGVYELRAKGYGEFWNYHDCDQITGIVESMGHVCHPVVTAHTAGWTWKDGERSYFYGLGVDLEYQGKIPAGFQLKEIPGSYYLVFSHPPFDYLRENCEVMKRVEDLAWTFDIQRYGWSLDRDLRSGLSPDGLGSSGYRWNEEICPDYQRHYPEGLGYQVLRPVIRK